MRNGDIFFLHSYRSYFIMCHKDIECSLVYNRSVMYECVLSLLAAQERYFLNEIEHAKCLYRIKIDCICVFDVSKIH